MEHSQKQLSLFPLLLFSIFLIVGRHYRVEAATTGHRHHHRRNNLGRPRKLGLSKLPERLFVFGDSYVDTGNTDESDSISWTYPYGITFPETPAGRFSDGHVLSDYVAMKFGLESPIAYELRNSVSKRRLQHGMNFAYGGTGVFDTSVPYPNITSQIDLLNDLIQTSVYNTTDMTSSIALVSVSGNDYIDYLHTNHHRNSVESLLPKVVKQIGRDLRRIHELGMRDIFVTGLEPSGCVPGFTMASSYKQCNDTTDLFAALHNYLLSVEVDVLNIEAVMLRNGNGGFVFHFLDLYNSFLNVWKNETLFKDPLRPCCVGISEEYSCGDVAEDGEERYTVCEDPESSFFWDGRHPTDAGWNAVVSHLEETSIYPGPHF